jgi:hypothetical protein
MSIASSGLPHDLRKRAALVAGGSAFLCLLAPMAPGLLEDVPGGLGMVMSKLATFGVAAIAMLGFAAMAERAPAREKLARRLSTWLTVYLFGLTGCFAGLVGLTHAPAVTVFVGLSLIVGGAGAAAARALRRFEGGEVRPVALRVSSSF